jgi:Ca2+-binding RTX toxin-like protein
MVGQEGDDTYYIDSSGDQTIESYPTFGIDHAITSISRTISTNIENMTLVGTAVLGSGNALANVLIENELANRLNGVAGDDTLIGRAGNDTLICGPEADRMEGGVGDDSFRFVMPGDGVDTLVDFTRGTDQIVVVAVNFGLLAGGTADLQVNASPNSGIEMFIYTSATGSLAFDADGYGPGAALTLALLQNKPVLIVPADIGLGP